MSGPDDEIRTLESLQKQAEFLKCTFYSGAPNLLLLDLDDPNAFLQFHQMLKLLQEHIDVTKIDEWTSRSGSGLHVVLRIDAELSIAERAGLQACLGSDPRRELLAIVHDWSKQDENPGLFKPKAEPTAVPVVPQ
jgi:hypothetical protein